ncbi:Various polyols ABC transporter, periplasmic substrate-binding protein [Pseudonocardia sp. Ae717_Ps2]|uniref:ABC transporter substrate-binding protein n=1 Tax=Pseudonocardia sp. Ae717_Ps2 TaxID=1885573 RepID=UPI00094AE035|nr:sugar ABC transporter substrate-binding protein [Pseudonocardia sp. Ae717_Ps2]OLM28580.1 Various polyols ABC transporter, periplasmic substrate-binding protein [Pseudonocardia sp. Ae717_Ps2]
MIIHQSARPLSPRFEAENPGIKLRFVSLSENEARAKITASVATGGDEFDAVMISNYETPQWAENGWLVDLDPLIAQTPGYDQDDFIPSVRDALSGPNGHLYSVPFYGESSFLMYRTDLFEQAGLTMPAQPTWEQIAYFAQQLTDRERNLAGICLRGKPGWGEGLGPMNTVVNSFGGRWYDENWNAQLTSPEVRQAFGFYVDLLRDYGQPGGAVSGFSECATQFSQGNTAMWYDATSAANTVENPDESRVVGQVGYAPAPTGAAGRPSDWLYTWSLGIPQTTADKGPEQLDATWKFLSWMTSKPYQQLVGNELGWSQVPPGSRRSLYETPQYLQASEAFAQKSLDAISRTDQNHPTRDPAPYVGLQFLSIPEWQDLGTRVSQQISAAVAGQQSTDEALEQAQQYAQTVGDSYQRAGEGQ